MKFKIFGIGMVILVLVIIYLISSSSETDSADSPVVIEQQ